MYKRKGLLANLDQSSSLDGGREELWGTLKQRVLSIMPKIPEIKWKGPFRFLPTGIFGITSGGGPLISVGIFRPKIAVPFLTNRFFALIREFGKGKNSGKSHSYFVGPV